MKTELMPCPCCGNNAKPRQIPFGILKSRTVHYVECVVCRLRTPVELDIETAAETWNRRAKTCYSAPKLMPMGALTYAIACSHCKNRESSLCKDCRCEVTSGFELDLDTLKEAMDATVRDNRTVQNNEEETEMKQYIGTKMIEACPAYRCTYPGGMVVYAGEGDIIPTECKIQEGYRVRYEDGYLSWSPKAVFEEAYRETTGMPFGLAIEAAKKGKRIARAGWNGKGMYVFMANEDITFTTSADMSEFLEESVEVHGMLVLRTAQKTLQPGWLASQADMLADDWMIVE
jgi:hypothetical protein